MKHERGVKLWRIGIGQALRIPHDFELRGHTQSYKSPETANCGGGAPRSSLVEHLATLGTFPTTGS